jgi:hypothetical protein
MTYSKRVNITFYEDTEYRDSQQLNETSYDNYEIYWFIPKVYQE